MKLPLLAAFANTRAAALSPAVAAPIVCFGEDQGGVAGMSASNSVRTQFVAYVTDLLAAPLGTEGFANRMQRLSIEAEHLHDQTRVHGRIFSGLPWHDDAQVVINDDGLRTLPSPRSR